MNKWDVKQKLLDLGWQIIKCEDKQKCCFFEEGSSIVKYQMDFFDNAIILLIHDAIDDQFEDINACQIEIPYGNLIISEFKNKFKIGLQHYSKNKYGKYTLNKIYIISTQRSSMFPEKKVNKKIDNQKIINILTQNGWSYCVKDGEDTLIYIENYNPKYMIKLHFDHLSIFQYCPFFKNSQLKEEDRFLFITQIWYDNLNINQNGDIFTKKAIEYTIVPQQYDSRFLQDYDKYSLITSVNKSSDLIKSLLHQYRFKIFQKEHEQIKCKEENIKEISSMDIKITFK